MTKGTPYSLEALLFAGNTHAREFAEVGG